jgi:hypothetical protein
MRSSVLVSPFQVVKTQPLLILDVQQLSLLNLRPLIIRNNTLCHDLHTHRSSYPCCSCVVVVVFRLSFFWYSAYLFLVSPFLILFNLYQCL